MAENELVVDQRRMPTYAQLSVMVNRLVTERDGEWAGIPMPLPGQGLVVEDRNPWRDRLAEIQRIFDTGQTETAHACMTEDLDLHLVNNWYSHQKGGDVLVIRREDGSVTWGLDPAAPKRNRFLIGAFDALDAWNLETETVAMERLSDLLTLRMFTAYVCCGQFLETSKRSGLTYLFRRGRPTLVLSPHGTGRRALGGENDGEDHGMRILCALCLHPIGYYAHSRCGVMTPTDDVIAHLLMMRASEPMLWRRANQHAPHRPESGVW